MTLTSISPETDVMSFSSCSAYIPLSGRKLGDTVSSVYVGLVVMETRSSAVVSTLSPKVHLVVGIGYPVMGTLMVRGWGTMTSRPFLKALRSKVGPTVTTEGRLLFWRISSRHLQFDGLLVLKITSTLCFTAGCDAFLCHWFVLLLISINLVMLVLFLVLVTVCPVVGSMICSTLTLESYH